MIIVLRSIAAVALIYNGWIIFRVVKDWAGLMVAVISVLSLPISTLVMPVLMFLIPSRVAGPLSLWPAIFAIGFLSWFAEKRGLSLLIKLS